MKKSQFLTDLWCAINSTISDRSNAEYVYEDIYELIKRYDLKPPKKDLIMLTTKHEWEKE